MTENKVAIDVPPAATVEVIRADSFNVSGRFQALSVHTGDGHIVAANVSGERFDFDSGDGRTNISNVTFTGNSPHLHIHTSDGSVKLSGIFSAPGAYGIDVGDGRVDTRFFNGSNVTVQASTGDGSISVDGNRHAGSPVKVGNGEATMTIHTQDGSIRITTNGA